LKEETAGLWLLQLPALERRVCLKKAKIYELISQDLFPKPVVLSGRRVAWVSAEIDDWIRGRMEQRDATKKATVEPAVPDEALGEITEDLYRAYVKSPRPKEVKK
jgi:prophage regulatory protein